MGRIEHKNVNDTISGETVHFYKVVRDDGSLVGTSYEWEEAKEYLKIANELDKAEKEKQQLQMDNSSSSSDSTVDSDYMSTSINDSSTVIENGSEYDQDSEDDVPDNKGILLTTGQKTNSFATDKIKSYQSTESADQVKEEKTESLNTQNETSDSNPEKSSDNRKSKVDVKSISQNAGGIQNAVSDLITTVTSVSTLTITELINEYTNKFINLPLTVPSKISENTIERFNKSKGDKDKNGNEYNPVKIDMGEAMKSFIIPSESQIEEKSKEIDEKNKNKIIDETKDKANKVKASVTKVIDKSTQAINDIMSHTLEGIDWVQQQVDNEISKVENNVKKELNTAYKKAEDDINNFCEGEAEKIATRMIKQYNNTIMNTAKNIVDNQNKAKTKATIIANAAIQKSKLKIFALLGL